jgi:hypothetical protein
VREHVYNQEAKWTNLTGRQRSAELPRVSKVRYSGHGITCPFQIPEIGGLNRASRTGAQYRDFATLLLAAQSICIH